MVDGKVMSKVFVSKISGKLEEKILESFQWIKWENIIHPDSKIFIKPNFTFPVYKPGVTTSPEFLESLIKVLKTRCNKITVGETDGGYHAWKAEVAFKGHRMYEICEKYSVKLLNLYDTKLENIEFKIKSKKIKIPLPSLLLHDTDVFISVPVPKIHCMTGVSLGLKNQWGCILDPMRLRYHHIFSELIVAINKLLKPAIVIADASYMLDRNGPMDGDVLQADLIITSNDIGAFELVVSSIMGIKPDKIKHLKVAKREEILPNSLQNVIINENLDKYYRKFYLKRTLQNWLAFAAFNNYFLTKMVYDSWLAGPIHKLLYAIKGKPSERTYC